jgi:hypothetical protein
MPDIVGAEYLLEHLNNIGWCTSTGMGLVSISFQEIDAYMSRCQINLSGDEVLLIKKMSQAYCSQVQNKDPSAKAPYGEVKASVMASDSIKNAFGGLATVIG